MYTKDEIIDKVIEIREEIGHDYVEPQIREIHEYDGEISIITPDRPEKSIIIGKGGWVVGRLREQLQAKSIHVISYTDIILKKYQLELSQKHLEKQIENDIPEQYTQAFTNLLELVKTRRKQVYNNRIITDYITRNIDRKPIEDSRCLVALSGGTDSTFTTILLKALGFNTKSVTVDPGTIILPKQFKHNIDKLTEKLEIEHEYLETDINTTITQALQGKIHPCGRCSKHIEDTINKKAEEDDIKVVAYGDLLSTGTQSLTKKDDTIRVNLPALLRMEKTEEKNITTKYGIKKIEGYGCPLIVQVHKKYPQYRSFSIQRVLRETRAGILEPGEALTLIRTI